jgi:hypothetical protein
MVAQTELAAAAARIAEETLFPAALASGCLTTTFAWNQHHGAVRTVAEAAPQALRREWLGPLCAGTRRADERVTLIEDYEHWRARDAAGLRPNGALALGVTRRCCALLGPSGLDGELLAAREQLDQATPETMPAARARASLLAMRAATRLALEGGGRSMLTDHHAQRLAREAMFLLVFGQTASIRAAQLDAAMRERRAATAGGGATA